MARAGLLLVPGIATVWTALNKVNTHATPDSLALSPTRLGALAVKLARIRHNGGSLTKAAFLWPRNDTIANVGTFAAALVTAYVWTPG